MAGMLALLDDKELAETRRPLESAAEAEGIEFVLSELESEGERGLAITYVHPEPTHFGASATVILKAARSWSS